MLELADRLGCAGLATGHYARTAEPDDARGPLLRAAADPAKDQTYMLAALAPASLARLRFPLGNLHKSEVRNIAAAAGLPVAAKPDSQDLCFLAGTTRQQFLARHGDIPNRPGPIVTTTGTQVGAHNGQHLFTVGQRRGLHVHHSEPLYVLDKDAVTATVTVGPQGAAAHRPRRGPRTLGCTATAPAWTGSSCATAHGRSGPTSRPAGAGPPPGAGSSASRTPPTAPLPASSPA